MHARNKLFTAICLQTLVATGLATSAASVHAAAGLEEIIVTARKTEESSQKVPISLTAFSGEDLLKKGATNFSDLAQSNPGVKITSGGAGSVVGTTIAIRGNIQNDTTFQTDAAVGTYVDGFIIARTFGMNGEMIDIESVQTLKGPQGTLFGRNTTGGALVIQTKNPERELGGSVRAEYGSYDLLHFTGIANLPVTDNAAVRLVADESTRKGWAEQVDGQDWGDLVTRSYRGKLLVTPDDVTTVLLAAQYIDQHGTSILNEATQPNDPTYHNIPLTVRPPATGLLMRSDEKNQVEIQNYTLNVTRDMSWGEMKFLAGERKTDVVIHLSLPPRSGVTSQDKPGNDQQSYELQANGSAFDDALQITSGLYYFRESTHERQHTQSSTQTAVNADTETRSQSAYVQGIYALTDAVNLIVGGRYTSDSRDLSGHYNFVPLNYSADKNKFNYLVSMDYTIAEDKLIYVSTSTGYRAGSAGIAPSLTIPGSWSPIKPEEITNYEMGVKTEWLDRRVRFNAAIYSQDYSDYQSVAITRQPSGALVRGYDNVDADIKGGEAELSFAATDNLRVGGSYAHTDALTTSSPTALISEVRLPNVPMTTYSVFAEQGVSTAIGELALRADYSWRDSFSTSLREQPQSRVDDVGLLNMSATLNVDAWVLSAYVKNATDERYYAYINYLSVPLGGPTNTVLLNTAALGEPRTMGVSASYSF